EQVDAAAAASPEASPAPASALPVIDASSGATLTDPADAVVANGEPVAKGDLRHTLSSRPSRSLRQAANTAAQSKPGDTEKHTDASSSDSMRKRSSFWKRSSTFISGGLARATQKAGLEPHTLGASSAPASSEKHQLGQFRVLSGRIFSDGKGSFVADAAGDDHPMLSLSAHVPRMHVDPSTGMVSIWADGKLVPADTECAAIQQEYHDLVATDPLLSIYFLVKERREREARHALHYQNTKQDVAAQLHQRPSTRDQIAQTTAQPAVGEVPAVNSGSKDAWVKLDRVSKKPSIVQSAAEDRGTKAAQDIASAISGSSSAERRPETASAATSQPAEVLLEPRPSTARDISDAGTAAAAVDQTTAAIEALSRGSGMLSAPQGAGATPGPGFQDTRRKRSSIFKRLSVMVKGARSGSKASGAHSDSTSRIVQAEGKEAGYMEISVQKGDGDQPAVKDTGAEPAQQHSPSRHLLNAESIGARLRGNTTAQKYTALDCIDEDKEYTPDTPADAALQHSAEAAIEHAEPSHALENRSPEPSERQYLDKLLCNETNSTGNGSGAPHSSSPAGRISTPVLAKGAASSDTSPKGGEDADEGSRKSSVLPDVDGESPTNHLRASHDLDDTSSMFTSTDIEDSAAITSPRTRGSPSEKAALLEKARREIEGLDEEEGVGLLDQTPELSYRVTGQFSKANFDSKKRRARSSSNTVVRMLTDIVRDAGSGAGSRAGRAVQGAKATFPHVSGLGGRSHAKTILRHSSTGAINRAGSDGPFDGRLPRTGQPVVRSPEEADSFAPADAATIAAGRPDILRSHSHTVGNSQRALALPDCIAEVPESPARARPAPMNALGIETAPESDQPRNIQAADSKCEDLSGTSAARGLGDDSNKNSSGSGLVDLNSSVEPTSPAGADDSLDAENDIMNSISNAPPRADEHLKPVFLKGLFSVSTTSTRSPTVIRANLLGVLGEMPLRFHEGKGYFTCSMATTGGPTNIQESVLDAYAQNDSAASKNSSLHKQKRALRLPVVDRTISFRRKSKRLDEAALALTAADDKPAAHDDMSSNDGNASDSHQSAAEPTRPARGLRRPSRRRSSSTAICFQIFLVRMPLLGLHGLQFRRVSGPAWKYKDVCSEILKRLKL
ncbi:Serine/threonine-protein kinase, partial [Coemansia sp. RSA 2611]